MKNGRKRNRFPIHDKTPSVICLPPPAPPFAAPNIGTQSASAFSFPILPEPIVTQPDSARDTAPTTQRKPGAKAKRQPQRAKAKSRSTVMAAKPAKAEAPAEALAPLPKSQSLALVPQGMMRQLAGWLRSLVVVKKPLPRSLATSRPHASAAQIRTLRRQVAALQKTLDTLA